MSRTDKDRPWWVATLQDDNYIAHDHRNGACIEETHEYAKLTRSRWSYAPHHGRNCAKRVKVTEYCTKSDPHRDRHRQTCWTMVCACPIPATWRDEYHACDNRERVGCIGYSRYVYDESISCSCDDWPESPTCSIEPIDRGRYRWTAGGVPSWFVRSIYHGPERTRERKLRDLAREYNTYGDLEDGDFENRQARNSARWDWW